MRKLFQSPIFAPLASVQQTIFMRKLFQSTLFVPLVALVVILLSMAFGRNYERAVLSFFLNTTTPAPYFLQPASGNDNVAWLLRTVSNEAIERDLAAPALVILEDNREGVFQASPHAPIDLALIFRNMERLGGGSTAVGAVMAWEAPDAIGLAALERALDLFDSVVTTVPLARGATSESMPAAFRRASLPLSVVQGDASGLPVVNRQAFSGALLGGENALAGFTFLEPADNVAEPSLIARWDDRVVFSFPFLVAVHKAGLGLDALQIRPGSHIHVGTAGWIIPINDAGRLVVRTPTTHDWPETPAEWLLDADPELWAATARPDLWLLRDDRSALDAAFRAQSERLVPLVRTIASGAALTKPRELRGVPKIQAWLLMAAVVMMIGAFTRIGGWRMQAGLALMLLGLVVLQWSALSLASLWMPVMPAILAVNVAWVLAYPTMVLARRGRSAPGA